MLKKFSLRPRLYKAFLQLDCFARSGDYDVDHLREIQSVVGVVGNKTVSYYLASLYLQLNEESLASDLLARFKDASDEMKRYLCVLNFSRSRQLPTPKLSSAEVNCLDYLQVVVNPIDHTIEKLINDCGGFSIVGNAPNEHDACAIDSSCQIYFNDYKKNQRIVGDATIHVVTPSWKIDSSDPSDYLFITGNNTFYRRSRVWQKFIKCQRYTAIYTVPRMLWAELSAECGSSPSAGILLLSHVTQQLREGKLSAKTKGYVAGFSSSDSGVNHAYDAEPASERHSWAAEALIYQARINDLHNYCADFTTEA